VVAEPSLDRVRFSAGDKQQQLFELEIELKGQGTDEDLRVLVGALSSHWLVQPEPYSKLERALALLGIRAESELVLSAEERMALQAWAGRPNRKSRRAVALLALSDGMSRELAAAKSRLSVRSVRYWLGRFKCQRLGIFPPTPAPDMPVTGGKGAKRKRRSLSRRRKDATRPLQALPAPEGGEAQLTLPEAPGVTRIPSRSPWSRGGIGHRRGKEAAGPSWGPTGRGCSLKSVARLSDLGYLGSPGQREGPASYRVGRRAWGGNLLGCPTSRDPAAAGSGPCRPVVGPRRRVLEMVDPTEELSGEQYVKRLPPLPRSL
jgi:hypothetical protein